MEKQKEVICYKVAYQCDECCKGSMIPTGQVYMSNPPQYLHICNNPDCGHAVTFDVRYPITKYEPL